MKCVQLQSLNFHLKTTCVSNLALCNSIFYNTVYTVYYTGGLNIRSKYIHKQ